MLFLYDGVPALTVSIEPDANADAEGIKETISASFFRFGIRTFVVDCWQCFIQQFFGGAGFSTSVARRKTVVQLGSLGQRCKPSPVGSRGETLEIFAYFAFGIAQNIALLALRQGTLTKAYTINQHF